MGHDEARANAPRVGREAARAPRLQEVVAINDREVETELLRQLVLPLQQHGGRRRHDHDVNAPAQEHLPHDEAGLYRLAESNIVGDEQVHAREFERLRER